MFEDVKNCGAGKFISRDEWKHPERIIDFYELIFVTKGTVYMKEKDVEYSLGEGEILILEPQKLHYGYKFCVGAEFFWLHWKSDLKDLMNIKHRKIEDPYNISLYFRQLIEARVTQKPPEALDYLTRLILIEAYINGEKPNLNPIVEKIAAWIRANNDRNITELQIATQFGYNVDYMNRLFKANFSITVKQYVVKERIKYIKTLMLVDNLPLKEIAFKAGFDEYKYFLKFFKYHEKITPTNFYKQYSKIYISS